MKSILSLVLPCAMLILATACSPEQNTGTNTPAAPVAQACTVNSHGQLMTASGQACGNGTNTCAAQGLTFNSTTGACQAAVAPTPSPTPYPVSLPVPTPTPTPKPPGGGVITPPPAPVISCAYWNNYYAGYGVYYVPMNTSQGYYCVNIADYVPDYTDYYTVGTVIYGSSCPYDAYTCEYGTNGSGYWDNSSGSTCIGVGAGEGGSYGISGYFSVCF